MLNAALLALGSSVIAGLTSLAIGLAVAATLAQGLFLLFLLLFIMSMSLRQQSNG